jgi:hypothetical protein
MAIKFRTPVQVFRKWLKELRSGKYDQAQGCLREVETDYDYDRDVELETRVVGFCCLGVLQDIAVKDGGDKWDSCYGPSSGDGEPDQKIRNYLGLNDEIVAHLIEMNDDEGADFNEIADEIEFNIMPALGLK